MTYDDWKATDPRDSEPDYELEGEEEPPRCECGEPRRLAVSKEMEWTL